MASPEAEPCPLDDRRTSKELWVKLVVVHFTTVTALCHLLSIRGEKIQKLKLFFIISVPIIFVVQHVLALLVILVTWAYFRITSERHEMEKVKKSLRWLFGRVDEPTSVTYTPLPTQTASTSRPTTISAKPLGRIIVVLAFLAQCIGTIYVFRRREMHAAVTIADERVLALGCSGILTAILTLALLLKLPVFNEPIPQDQPSQMSWLEHLAFILRDTSIKGYDNAQPARVLTTSGLCFILIIIKHHRPILKSFSQMWSSAYWQSDKEDLLTFGLVIVGIPASLAVALISTCDVNLESKATRYGLNGRKRSRRKRGDKPWYLALCCPFVAVALFFPMVIVAIYGFTWFYGIFDFITIADQISTLKEWPTNTTCPLLWSDPVSEWVWWLA